MPLRGRRDESLTGLVPCGHSPGSSRPESLPCGGHTRLLKDRFWPYASVTRERLDVSDSAEAAVRE
jgi:hypothetical protein